MEAQGLGVGARPYRGLEAGDVGRPARAQPELFGAAADDRVLADDRPESVDRFPERRARVLLIELRPEERDQAVASMESEGLCGGEVGEQRKALGLDQGLAQVPPFFS